MATAAAVLATVGFAATPGMAAPAPATIPVGNSPGAVAINPAGTDAYVINSASSSVSVIDLATNTVTATVTVGLMPSSIVSNPAGTDAYVVNSASNSVSVIDLATNTVTVTIAVGLGPASIVLNPAGTDAYVINQEDATVSVIDLATNTVTASLPTNTPYNTAGLPKGGDYADGVAINPAGTYAYVTNLGTDSGPGGMSVIDLATKTVTVTVPTGGYPLGLAINPSGTDAYVTNDSGDPNGTVSDIDLATNTVTATIPLVGDWKAVLRPDGIAINRAGTDAYVIAGNDLFVIDLATNTVTATVGLGTFQYAFDAILAINPSGTYAYVADSALSGAVSVIDLATNTLLATISAGGYPGGSAINPAGTDAYVTNYFNGTVSVVDLRLADVGLSVSGPSRAAHGTTFTENVTVTNNGPSTAASVATNVYIPPGLTVTAAPGATVDAGMLDWDDPLLASGATVTYPVTLKVGATMQSIVALGGAAGGDGPDPYPMNNAAITTIQLG